jgi:hypothetical protein
MVFGDIYLTGAFIEQYHSIGWPQLYLGRVGTSWEKAYHAYSGRSTSEEIASHWSIAFISTLWEYARHIRNQRNSIIYGAEEAQAAQTIANNQQQIQNLFAEFQEDPSMILPHHCHQFTSKSVEDRLNQQFDDMNCWLRSVEEAQAVKEHHVDTLRSEAAHLSQATEQHKQRFPFNFLPRHNS